MLMEPIEQNMMPLLLSPFVGADDLDGLLEVFVDRVEPYIYEITEGDCASAGALWRKDLMIGSLDLSPMMEDGVPVADVLKIGTVCIMELHPLWGALNLFVATGSNRLLKALVLYRGEKKEDLEIGLITARTTVDGDKHMPVETTVAKFSRGPQEDPKDYAGRVATLMKDWVVSVEKGVT